MTQMFNYPYNYPYPIIQMDSYTTLGTQLASLRGDEICDPVFAIETRKSENRKFGNTYCLWKLLHGCLNVAT